MSALGGCKTYKTGANPSICNLKGSFLTKHDSDVLLDIVYHWCLDSLEAGADVSNKHRIMAIEVLAFLAGVSRERCHSFLLKNVHVVWAALMDKSANTRLFATTKLIPILCKELITGPGAARPEVLSLFSEARRTLRRQHCGSFEQTHGALLCITGLAEWLPELMASRVLLLREMADPLFSHPDERIRATTYTKLTPILASHDPKGFASHYLKIVMKWLLEAVGQDTSMTAVSCTDCWAAITSIISTEAHLLPYRDPILIRIQTGNSSARFCLVKLAQATGREIPLSTWQEVLDSAFERWQNALNASWLLPLARAVPQLSTSIWNRMFNFVHKSLEDKLSRKAASEPSVQGLDPWYLKQKPTDSKLDTFVLALRDFDFSHHPFHDDLFGLIVQWANAYSLSPDAIQGVAAIAFVMSRFPLTRLKQVSRRQIERINQALDVAFKVVVSASSHIVRAAALGYMATAGIDDWLLVPKFIDCIFMVAFSDENLEVRTQASQLLARLSPKNPLPVMQKLYPTTLQIIASAKLAHRPSDQVVGIKALSMAIQVCPHPSAFQGTISQRLLPLLAEIFQSPFPAVSSAALLCLAEAAKALGGNSHPWNASLLTDVADCLIEPGRVYEKEVQRSAVAALTAVLSNTGLTLDTCKHNELQSHLYRMLANTSDNDLAIDIIRLVGLLGVVEPCRQKVCRS